MDRTPAIKHRLEEQDVRAGRCAGESYPGLHCRKLLFQKLFDLALLFLGKSRVSTAGRVDHVAGKDNQFWDWEAIIESISPPVELSR